MSEQTAAVPITDSFGVAVAPATARCGSAEPHETHCYGVGLAQVCDGLVAPPLERIAIALERIAAAMEAEQ